MRTEQTRAGVDLPGGRGCAPRTERRPQGPTSAVFQIASSAHTDSSEPPSPELRGCGPGDTCRLLSGPGQAPCARRLNGVGLCFPGGQRLAPRPPADGRLAEGVLGRMSWAAGELARRRPSLAPLSSAYSVPSRADVGQGPKGRSSIWDVGMARVLGESTRR